MSQRDVLPKALLKYYAVRLSPPTPAWNLAEIDSVSIFGFSKIITYLFTKLPWPEDSEGTFWSSSQTVICIPHTVEASQSPFLIAECQAGIGMNTSLQSLVWLDHVSNPSLPFQ